MMTQTGVSMSSAADRPSPGWLSRLGSKLMDALGGERSGHDDGPSPADDDKCCHLALPDKECHYRHDKSSYTCPDGFHRQWWFCCEGSRQVGCGECTTSTSTCWSGEFECSIWWWTDNPC